MRFDVKRCSSVLQHFEFRDLFVEELGWNLPAKSYSASLSVKGQIYLCREIAQLENISVIEIVTSSDQLPDVKIRTALYKETFQTTHENILIFLDKDRTQSIWHWVNYLYGKISTREYLYVKGQPAELMLSKLEVMIEDFKDFSEHLMTEVSDRLQQELDVERVTKKFFTQFNSVHYQFLNHIEGIGDERDRRWYVSVLLNRLMFIYFLQRKGFIDRGNLNYLQSKLKTFHEKGKDLYYEVFLKTLFFEGFSKPETLRDDQVRALLGNVVYLKISLFLPHPIEERWRSIRIADAAFDALFSFFECYAWILDNRPIRQDNEVNLDVLGYIFEMYINQDDIAAYHTPPAITEYLCRQTIHNFIVEKINQFNSSHNIIRDSNLTSVDEMLTNIDSSLCRELFFNILPRLSLLDPACGSGAFLVSAVNTLFNIYSAIIGRAELLNDQIFKDALEKLMSIHPNLAYAIKKKITIENLFGVDIMEEATEISRFRLYLTLIASVKSVDELEPLPNLDFNIFTGNSLIGLLKIDETHAGLFSDGVVDFAKEKKHLINLYRETLLCLQNTSSESKSIHNPGLQMIQDKIHQVRFLALNNLNEMLLNQFNDLGIKYEQATWDVTKNKEGKSSRRALQIADIERLQPFHWGFEFNGILQERGGFDIIITAPSWKIFKPQVKEFFAEIPFLMSQKKKTIKDFEGERTEFLKDPDIQKAWLEYLSSFPHRRLFFRTAAQYTNQISTMGGKSTGADLNFYKLFLEQCYNLLCHGGQCGIVVPGGICTDLGSEPLRKLLFDKTRITGLLCFENRNEILEGLHHSFKFALLSFAKGEQTTQFPATFAQLDLANLESFPKEGSISISVDLIRKLSPDSLSIVELKSETDANIIRKMVEIPSLRESIAASWNLLIGHELHLTNDSHLFNTMAISGYLPVYEGKMIHQFNHQWSAPHYWIEEEQGRKVLMSRKVDAKQKFNYQQYRLAYRTTAKNTDERTLIATILPPNVFSGNSINTVSGDFGTDNLLFLTSVLNSFVLDFLLRLSSQIHISVFHFLQLRTPRFSEKEVIFRPVVERTARLICTTPEFKELWEAVMPDEPWSTSVAATSTIERAKIRAELDGLIAHFYGLTMEEFNHILNSFPLVSNQIKAHTQAEYQAFTNHTSKSPGELKPSFGDFESKPVLNPFFSLSANSTIETETDLSARTNPMTCLNCGACINSEIVRMRLERGLVWLNCPVCETRILLLDAVSNGRIRTISRDVGSILKRKRDLREFDVFLSYSNQDRLKVKEVARELSNKGILPWLDEEQILPGRTWQGELEIALHRGEVKTAVVFLGKDGNTTLQNKDIGIFLRDFIRRELPVIPVILPEFGNENAPTLPSYLVGLSWVDFRQSFPDPMERLIWGITGESSRLINISSSTGLANIAEDSNLVKSLNVSGGLEIVRSALVNQDDGSYSSREQLAETIVNHLGAKIKGKIELDGTLSGTLWNIELPILGLKLANQSTILYIRKEEKKDSFFDQLIKLTRQKDATFLLVVDRREQLSSPPRLGARVLWINDEQLAELVSLNENEAPRWLGRLITREVDISNMLKYQTAGVVIDMFFGREYEINQLLNDNKPTGGVLLGAHHSGKSSLMHKLYNLLETDESYGETNKPVKVSTTANIKAFFKDTIGHLDRSLVADNNNMTPTSWTEELKKYQARTGKKPIFFLDEVQLLIEQDMAEGFKLGTEMRALQYNEVCKFYLAGHSALRKAVEKEGSPYRNFAPEIILTGLDDLDAVRLIKEPIGRIGFVVSDQHARRIVKGTAGVAVLIQDFCIRLLLEVRRECIKGNEITNDLIFKIENDADYLNFVHSHFKYSLEWDGQLIIGLVAVKPGITKSELLVEFSSLGSFISLNRLQDLLNILIKFKIFKQEDGNYYIIPTYLSLYIKNNGPEFYFRNMMEVGKEKASS